mgnify:CR=1 FL=1
MASMGYSPAEVQQARQQMANMSSSDMSRMSEEMRKLSPEQLKQQMQGAATQMQAQNHYKYNASVSLLTIARLSAEADSETPSPQVTLKTDGNKAVAAGNFAEAAEKYVRARENLEGNNQKQALDLRLACTLNLALCQLKKNKNSDAEKLCTEALGIEQRSYKAYYRRALARKALGETEHAAAD